MSEQTVMAHLPQGLLRLARFARSRRSSAASGPKLEGSEGSEGLMDDRDDRRMTVCPRRMARPRTHSLTLFSLLGLPITNGRRAEDTADLHRGRVVNVVYAGVCAFLASVVVEGGDGRNVLN